MLNREKYADKMVRFFLDGTRIAVIKGTNEVVKCNSVCNCKDCIFSTKSDNCSFDKLQKWANREYKEPILTDEEREYLSAVCKPFEVDCIYKHNVNGSSYGWLCLMLNGEHICLPQFKIETMYKGMEPDNKYTPQELGITCKNNRGNND